MSRSSIILLGLVASLLFACGTSPQALDGAATSRGPTPSITGTIWRLERLEVATAPTMDPAAPRPTVQLEPDGRMRGFAGVNRCSGSVAIGTPGALGEVSLRFGPIASTRMAGPPERMAVEQAFLRMLGEVRGARAASGADGGADTLVMLGDEGALARFVAESAPTPDE
ncbi:MAG: META domain-containing protein [Phycisphaerales bacterium]|jgi:heat shock protein HslJ